MNPVTIHYRTGTPRDLRLWGLLWSFPGMRWGAPIAMATMAVLFMIPGFVTSKSSSWVERAVITLIAEAAVSAYYVLMAYRVKQTLQRQQAENPPAEITTTFSEEELQIRSPKHDVHTQWGFYRKAGWTAADDEITLDTGGQRLLFPRTAFASQADYDAVRELLTRKIGPAKK